MPPKTIFIALAVLAALSFVGDSFFVVNQQQQALILQFREPMRVIKDPGLNFKIPLIQEVVFFDKRVLPIEAPEQEAILADQKRLVVDAFARYRISDPLKYFQRLNNERIATDQLGTVVNSSMRQVLGTMTLKDVLSAERSKVMNSISEEVNAKSKDADYGVEIVDVRIRRADFPAQTSQAIFERMKSERVREAKEIRAKGEQLSQEIRSKADRERTILLAEAQKQAETTRGQGDEEALKIMASAAGKDTSFFNFYRSMQAYRETLANKDTSFVLSPDSEFFRYFSKTPR